MYLLLNLLSMGSLMGYIRQRAETGELAPYLGVEPPVSVLMPAFNEEATIRTSVRSMLQLQYPEFEIVVINDGSKDRTLAVLIEEFDRCRTPSRCARPSPTNRCRPSIARAATPTCA